MSVKIIAEIGCNHNGSLERAKEMVRMAHDCGVDYVKFQARNPLNSSEDIYDSPLFGKIPYREHRRRLEFNEEQFKEIDYLCQVALEIEWFASVFDIDSFNLINQFNPKRWKIPPIPITEKGLLEKIVAEGKQTYVSTGMMNKNRFKDMIKIVNPAYCTLMHTYTVYPTQLNEVNLKMISKLKGFGFNVGYSGHDNSLAVTVAAIAFGATVIEKHITLDRSMPGTDHSASLEEAGLRKLVNDIRSLESAIGDGEFRLLDGEIASERKMKI